MSYMVCSIFTLQVHLFCRKKTPNLGLKAAACLFVYKRPQKNVNHGAIFPENVFVFVHMWGGGGGGVGGTFSGWHSIAPGSGGRLRA